ncbi:MAG TPA: hypothetical protein VFM01_03250 [Nakamurella sp.]|nr:hypothetical protein [Nakamurella sp.]
MDAAVADTMPQYIQVTGAPTVTGHAGAQVVTWQQTSASIVFTDDLSGGSTGLVAGQIVPVKIPARLDPGVPYAASGTDLDNTATISAANADPQRSTATVTPQIELDLNATVTKNIDPTDALPEPGTPLSVDLTGSNQSNTAVHNRVISDPVDPTATPSPFEYLSLTGLGAVTLPEGAETVTVSAFVDGSWIDGTPGSSAVLPDVDPCDGADRRSARRDD